MCLSSALGVRATHLLTLFMANRNVIKSDFGAQDIPAINGMRAVAVLSILVFHIDEAFLPGGFVGVDIFFVISGFIVAYASRSHGSTSVFAYFLDFYRRRVLRIYPVLLLFVFVALVLSVLFVPRVQSSKLIELTGASSVLGLSNFFLWLTSGDYFSTAAEYNLFTHTWSLAVEEQYYLIYPLFAYFALFGSNERNRRLAICFVVVAMICSFLLCVALQPKYQSAAFYLTPFRFWELAAGFLLCVFSFGPKGLVRLPSWCCARFRAALAIFSVGLLAVSLICADGQNFPYPWAIAPTLATVLIIFVVLHSPNGLLSLFLSNQFLRWLGRVSFSLYLWHWLVIVLMKWTVGLDEVFLKVMAVLITLLLSAASYAFIEDPARKAAFLREMPSPKFFVITFLSIFSVVGFGLLGFLAKPKITLSTTGNLDVWDPNSAYHGASCASSKVSQSFYSGFYFHLSPDGCSANGRKIFVVGDSHAGAYMRLYSRLAAEDRFEVYVYTMGGCKLISTFDQKQVAGCADFKRHALAGILNTARSGDVVFFPGHYTRRYRDTWEDEIVPTSDIDDAIDGRQDLVELTDMLSPLVNRGLHLLIEGPKPIARSASFRCADWFSKYQTYCTDDPRADRADLLLRSSNVSEFQTQLAERIGATIWKPFDVLCPPRKEKCDVQIEGSPIFYDTDHLSAFGNDLLYPSIRGVVEGMYSSKGVH